MTRKEIQTLAATVKRMDLDYPAREEVARCLCAAYTLDYDKFLKACGVKP